LKLSIGKKGNSPKDNVILRWGAGYPATDNFDGKYDALDFRINDELDLSVRGSDGTLYSIFHGTELKSSKIENRIVDLEIKKLEIGDYYFTSKVLSKITGGNIAYLYDKFTQQTFNLNTHCQDDCIYYFNVNNDYNSKAENRFSVIFNDTRNLEIKAEIVSLFSNIINDNQDFIIQSNSSLNNIKWELVDNLGRNLKSGTFTTLIDNVKYRIPGGFLSNGCYFIKLYDNNNKLISILKALKL